MYDVCGYAVKKQPVVEYRLVDSNGEPLSEELTQELQTHGQRLTIGGVWTETRDHLVIELVYWP